MYLWRSMQGRHVLKGNIPLTSRRQCGQLPNIAMTQRDYYEVLEVKRTADADEIKRAYRKMALKYHPDHNPDDAEAEARFKEAAEAYEVLRDPERRARYDQYGHAGVKGNGNPFGGFSSNEDIFAHFGDIFGDIFGFGAGGGSRGGGSRPQAGADLRYNLSISFEQAARGAEISLSIPRQVTCKECDGSGAAKGSTRETCRHCNGTGQVRHTQGFFQFAVTCPHCKGEGTTVSRPCPKCKGAGTVRETQELSVRVPAGVDTGTRLRLRNEGEAGVHGGPNGDLYVFLTVEESRDFRREGQDLIVTREISFPQAALGVKIEVTGLDGPLEVKIPRGTQNNAIFRLSGEGLPYVGQKRKGDLLVEVRVVTPVRLSSRQEELLREFEKVGEEKPLSKVKKAAKRLGKVIGME